MDLLLHEFPDLDPIISVYAGAFQCESALRGSEARASLVTVVGVPLDSLRTGCPPAPAVFRSDEALMLRPGFLASALREPKARRRILTSTTTTVPVASVGSFQQSDPPLLPSRLGRPAVGVDPAGEGSGPESVPLRGRLPLQSPDLVSGTGPFGSRAVAVFDLVRHAWLLPVCRDASLVEIVEAVLQASWAPAAPLSATAG